jgi:hypothetical protein
MEILTLASTVSALKSVIKVQPVVTLLSSRINCMSGKEGKLATHEFIDTI